MIVLNHISHSLHTHFYVPTFKFGEKCDLPVKSGSQNQGKPSLLSIGIFATLLCFFLWEIKTREKNIYR